MNSKHQEKRKLGHVVQIHLAVYHKVNVTDDKQLKTTQLTRHW